MKLKVGTRGSKLALAYAERVCSEISHETEIVIIKTDGDLNNDAPIHEIGGKGVFCTAIENELLGNGPIYAVDGLSTTGLRARRWLNELPGESAERIEATIIDMNQFALDLALKTHEEFPPIHSKGELKAINGDLRSAILNQGWHWVDIDPYGSLEPIPLWGASCML